MKTTQSLSALVAFLALPALANAGTIETIAGTGKAGYSGDGGPALAAQLSQPFHCDFDSSGDLYIVEQFNHCVRKLNMKAGVITTVAGCGKKGYTGDGGPATQATMDDPHSVVVDKNGDLYVADRMNAAIRKVDGKTGIMTTVAGTGKKGSSGDGGPGAKAQLVEPDDCCLDGKGGLLIADVGDWRIRRLDLKTGMIATFAGTGRPRGGRVDKASLGEGGPATKAVVVGARAVCVDGKGNTYICLREGHGVRKVDANGIITTIAGTGSAGYSGDGGPALAAKLNGPKAIRCDLHGNIYVCDTENHAVRKIDAKTGVITAVAGGREGSGGDGGDALQAALNRPHGCLVAADGTLYITDSGNNRVRRVSAK
jgi:streptogramin lyase